MRHWRLSAAFLASIVLAAALSLSLAFPASSAPILYSDAQPDGIDDIAVELIGLGSALATGTDTLIVGGRMDVSDVAAVVLTSDTFDPVGSLIARRGIATSQDQLALVTVNEAGAVETQLHEISATEIRMLTSVEVVPTEDPERFGTELAINESHVAVVDTGQGQDPDVVVIFEIGQIEDEYSLTESLRIETGLAHLHVSFYGDQLVVSGVPPLGNVGHLVVVDVDTGEPLDRIDNIGGGPIVVTESAVFVQRNQYFVQASGAWSMVSFDGAALGQPVEIPGAGASLAADEETILIGDPIRNQVLVFERTPNEARPFRFTQAVRHDNKNSSDQFGASVAIMGDAALIGAPGVTTEGFAFRGSLGLYGFADGPIGCTVVGTPGDDEKLTGTSGRDTMCGLDGADRILGFAGDDVIHGGPGDDALLGTGGDDILYGDAGDDILNGGDDNDLLFGGTGNDTGNGGAGDDTFIGGEGLDKGNGGDGANSCEAEQRFLC